jgi:hypothetical protein
MVSSSGPKHSALENSICLRANKGLTRMTLVIYLRCRGGCILISDRQVSEASGHREEDKKTYLSKAKDFMLGGAGTGFSVVELFWELNQDNGVNSNNIVEKLSQLINTYADRFSDAHVMIDALLVARESSGLVPYEIRMRGEQFYINPISVGYRCRGTLAARILADYFLKKRKLDEVPWLEAVQYAIATMTEVGKEVEGVGNLEDFGFDITVMLDDGSVREWTNCRENSASFAIDLKILRHISSKFNTDGLNASEAD